MRQARRRSGSRSPGGVDLSAHSKSTSSPVSTVMTCEESVRALIGTVFLACCLAPSPPLGRGAGVRGLLLLEEEAIHPSPLTPLPRGERGTRRRSPLHRLEAVLGR